MKKLLYLLLLLVLPTMMLTGCGGGSSAAAGGSISDGAMKVEVAYPQDQPNREEHQPEIMYYLIDIYQRGSVTEGDNGILQGTPLVGTTRIDYPDTSAVIDHIPVGEVEIVVVGYSGDNIPVYQGHSIANVTAGSNTAVEIDITPVPSPTITVSPTPTVTPTVSPTPTATPTTTPTPTPSPTVEPETYTDLTSVPYQRELESYDSYNTTVSDNGEIVVFASSQRLVPEHTESGHSSSMQIYLYDNINKTLRVISRAPDGRIGNSSSDNPYVSGNAQFVAFDSYASNLLGPDMDVNNKADIFIYDIANNNIGRVSTKLNQPLTGGNGDSFRPSLSYDGRFVAYDSFANDLIDFYSEPSYSNVFRSQIIRDRNGRLSTTNTLLVSNNINAGGNVEEGNNNSTNPRISRDGVFVVYESKAGNLDIDFVPAYNSNNIYLCNTNLSIGDSARNKAITRIEDIDPAIGAFAPHLSDNPQKIVFASNSPNLPGNGGNTITDVYVWQNNRTTLVSDYLGGRMDSSGKPTISSDGRYVAFHSGLSGLVPNDFNDSVDCFVKDLSRQNIFTRVSVRSDGSEAYANSGSHRPFISGNGQYIVFQSYDSTLAPMPDWGTGEIIQGVGHTYIRKWEP